MITATVEKVEFISPERAVVTALCGDGVRKQLVSYELGTKVQRALMAADGEVRVPVAGSWCP